MTNNRIINHPILGKINKQNKVTFTFNGERYEGYEHDTIASALLVNGIRTLRHHEQSGTPRGIYCNIGHCFECRVIVDGVTNVRACLTPIKQDMIVKSSEQQASPLHPDNESFPKTYDEYVQMKDGEQ